MKNSSILQDAHNAILNYDDNSSLFAVYDGHGGHEVAVYTAKKLPNYLKTRKDYRSGAIESGLVDGFVEFDRTLTERDVVRELRVIAGKEAANEEVDHEEVDNLYQEATMPIEAVMAKNGKSDSSELKAGNSKPASALTRLRNGESKKPISPFLRGPKSNGNGQKTEGNGEKTEENDDVKAKLSFNDEESEVIAKNGESNGHENGEKTEENGEKKEENGSANADIKGKGKGKGKGKSSQISKPKTESESEEPQEKVEEISPKKKPKSALELYQNLVNDEVMDEESEDEGESFGNDDDDDDDEDDDEEDDDESDEEEEEDSVDEDEEEADEEYIGGDFNEEVILSNFESFSLVVNRGSACLIGLKSVEIFEIG